MKDPERFLDRNDSELAGALLRSLKADAPRADSKRRALAAAVLAAASVKTSAGAAAGSLLASAGKWALYGALLGGSLAGGAALLEKHTPAAPVESTNLPGKPLVAEPAVSARAPELAKKPAEQPKSGPTTGAKPSASIMDSAGDLREQRLAIEQARRELAAHRPDRAIAALDEYRMRFSKLLFHQESIVLRIEALEMRGDHASARALGRTFLDASPESPLAPRVRSLIGVK